MHVGRDDRLTSRAEKNQQVKTMWPPIAEIKKINKLC